MPLLQIAAHADRLVQVAPPVGCPVSAELIDAGPEAAMRAALAGLDPCAPVVVLVHGRGYAPGIDGLDPHQLIFAPRSRQNSRRFISWPRRLGFALPGTNGLAAERGLCIGFGWDARGDIWTATRGADRTAAMLARLVQAVRRAGGDRPVDLIGHSLGARVILGALPQLAQGMVGRVLLMAGADFADRARAALASPAGAAAEVFNITSRENDLFDLLFERSQHPFRVHPAIGRGLADAANWLDIQIDHDETLARLAGLGFALPPPRARICHWSVYLRPGIFRLYRALQHDRQRTALATLRAQIATPPQPRWSRLVAWPLDTRPLPLARDALT